MNRLQKARIRLTLDLPFWAQLAFRLDHVFDTSVPTACTDGIRVQYAPAYVDSLNEPELVGLMVEEVGHCAFGHLWRRAGRQPNRWNQAADQVLWLIIADLQKSTGGRIALSKECKAEVRFAGMSVEEVYNLLAQENSPDDYQSPGTFTDPSAAQGDQDGGSSSQAASDLQQEWASAVMAAAMTEQQRNAGNLPAFIRQLVGDLTAPRVPWTEHVRQFCHLQTNEDYSFARANRRHIENGFVLPSLRSERLGPIVGAFDTSGSIFCQPKLVADILSEFQGVLDHCRPAELLLIDCDTQVHQQKSFLVGEDLRGFVPEGGGGTDFRPVFKAIAERGEEPACLIFLTDLEGEFPKEAPPYPVLWANFGNPRLKAPFGQTILVPAA